MSIANLERGERGKSPPLETVVRLARALGIRGLMKGILQNVLQNPDKITQTHAFLCIDMQHSAPYHVIIKPRKKRGFRGFQPIAVFMFGTKRSLVQIQSPRLYLRRQENHLAPLHWCNSVRRKRRGTFRFPAPGESEATSVSIKATDLIMLLDGVDLQSVKRRPRYVLESAETVKSPGLNLF